MKLNDGKYEISFEINQTGLIVELEAIQFHKEAVHQYELFLEASLIFLEGQIQKSDNESLVISYELPAVAMSIADAVTMANDIERIAIARKFSTLQINNTDMAQIFIHPQNLFLISERLYVAHRGLSNLITPNFQEEMVFLQQYKGLVISTINPKYEFEDLVHGKVKVRDQLAQSIMNASTVSEIERILDDCYYNFKKKQQKTVKLVNKGGYNFLKIASLSLVIITTLLSMGLFYLTQNTIVQQERIMNAQASFIGQNWGETVMALAHEKPEGLPPNAQYILAYSHIQLSTLTNQQKQAITNNLSPSSIEQELLYWIYSGRGKLVEAVDLAYSLGDIQLKIHAYSLRYDYVYLDNELPGIEKQAYLERYRLRLEELVATLEGGEEVDE